MEKKPTGESLFPIIRLMVVGISTILFATLAAQTQLVAIPDMTLEQIWPYLRGLGFDARTDGTPVPSNGIILLAGKRVRIGFGMRPKNRTDQTLVPTVLHLSFDYWPMKAVSARYLQDWQKMVWGMSPMLARVGLDGGIRLKSWYAFEPGGTESRLAAEIKSFEENLGQLFEELPEAETRQVRKLDENQKIDCLDGDDANYLVQQWNWVYRGGWGASSPTWICPAQVEGVTVFLKGAHPGRLKREGVLLSATTLDLKNVDVSRRVAEFQSKLKDLDISPGPGPRINFVAEVDLSGGMTVKEFKERIKHFARAVAPYVRANALSLLVSKFRRPADLARLSSPADGAP